MICYYNQHTMYIDFANDILRAFSSALSFFIMLFTRRERLRTSDSVLSKVRSKNPYDVTFDALPLKPSIVCNTELHSYWKQQG